MKWHKHLWDASKVYAPDFIRNCADEGTIQSPRHNRVSFVSALRSATENGMPGFYSVYSFPRGHSKEGNIPKVDCIFIDFDVTGEHYDPDSGDATLADWRRDMSALLSRTRMVARAIIGDGSADYFRVVLSGHKGIHLYLDFPAIDPANGEFGQFKCGLKSYAEQVVNYLDEEAGGVNIQPWVDVDGSDLGRLARHPNTRHHGASQDDVERWCVPITVEELADLTVDDYLSLTTTHRGMTDEMDRIESERAGNQVVQHVRTASTSVQNSDDSSSFKSSVARQYREESNDEIELEDVLFLTKNKPCIRAFRERDDAYEHGDSSRVMELSIMGRLIEMNVPLDVMHEFFETIPHYNEEYTDELLNDLIGRRYEEFNCVRIAASAGEFCLADDCSLYRRSDEIQVQ